MQDVARMNQREHDLFLLDQLDKFIKDLIDMSAQGTAHRELLEFAAKDLLAAVKTRMAQEKEE
jgi:hypothetical protein